MYIDRNKQNEIISMFAHPQREGHEFLEGAELHKSKSAKIGDLEATITPRRLREAVLTSEGKTWLADVEARISGMRAKGGK